MAFRAIRRLRLTHMMGLVALCSLVVYLPAAAFRDRADRARAEHAMEAWRCLSAMMYPRHTIDVLTGHEADGHSCAKCPVRGYRRPFAPQLEQAREQLAGLKERAEYHIRLAGAAYPPVIQDPG